MVLALLFCLVLVIVSTIIHYEMLRGLTALLPRWTWPARTQLIGVILGAFVAHAAEIVLYAVAIYLMSNIFGLGSLGIHESPLFTVALYFSAETFTSLGYGDIVPSGSLRLIAGVEALNGLLLIGWTASYTYLAMERLWTEKSQNGTGCSTSRETTG
jgi:hypothetical protein